MKTIKEINEKIPNIATEFFVHGAMCMSYSGRCNISNYLTGRDANQGDCAQSCRWQYKVYLEEVTRPGELMTVEEDNQGSYFFNSRDLCLLKHMDKVMKTGAVSLKIEGRNKSIYYVARVVSLYRQAKDLFLNRAVEVIPVETIDEVVGQKGYASGFGKVDWSLAAANPNWHRRVCHLMKSLGCSWWSLRLRKCGIAGFLQSRISDHFLPNRSHWISCQRSGSGTILARRLSPWISSKPTDTKSPGWVRRSRMLM